jgi:hypothetical protein
VTAVSRGRQTTSEFRTSADLLDFRVVFVRVFDYNTGMNSGELSSIGADPTAADLALDVLSTDLDHLIKIVEDGGLEGYDNSGLIGFMQSFERLRNRLPLIDHRVIIDAQRRNLADALTQRSLNRVLVQSLRLSPGEAARRVHAAEAVGERVSMLGQPLDPIRPLLGAAQRAGDVSPEQVQLIVKALAFVDRPGFDPADINEGERLLTGFAMSFGPKELSKLAARTVAAIDPDGTLPDEQLQQDRRHFEMRPTKDGGFSGEFRLTGSLGAKLSALLSPLTKPRVGTITRSDGTTVAQDRDERTRGQRLHDALEDICDRVLRVADVPASGGTPATVIVTIALDDLLAKMGHGTTSDGTLISTTHVLRLANQAEIVPTVLTRSGAVLDLGRSRRIASRTQTIALIARDGGCSFPGCDHPPEWCERHHIVEWIDGGETNLDNLTLLCRYHHHNFASRGWTCRMNSDRLPEWIPPTWVDRQQVPLLNKRITAARLARMQH